MLFNICRVDHYSHSCSIFGSGSSSVHLDCHSECLKYGALSVAQGLAPKSFVILRKVMWLTRRHVFTVTVLKSQSTFLPSELYISRRHCTMDDVSLAGKCLKSVKKFLLVFIGASSRRRSRIYTMCGGTVVNIIDKHGSADVQIQCCGSSNPVSNKASRLQ